MTLEEFYNLDVDEQNKFDNYKQLSDEDKFKHFKLTDEQLNDYIDNPQVSLPILEEIIERKIGFKLTDTQRVIVEDIYNCIQQSSLENKIAEFIIEYYKFPRVPF